MTRTREDPATSWAGIRSHWERFLTDGTVPAAVRPEIAKSWRRSRGRRIASEMPAVPFDEAALRGFDASGQARRQFAGAAAQLADHLASELRNTNSAVVVCDDGGLMLHRTGARDILRRTDRLNFVRGGIWDERNAGTNGIGLALATGATAHVSCAEHYVEAFHPFSCIASVVRHPVTREVLGVIDLTTDLTGADTFAPALISRAAREVEQLMEAQLFGRERQLLDRYLRGRAGSQMPVLTVDRAGHTIIQNARMLQSASAVDVELLLGIARGALRAEQDRAEELELSRGRSVVAAHLVQSGQDVIGALVSIERTNRHRGGEGEPAREHDWSPLVGRSPAIRQLLRDAGRVACRRVPVIVTGESGTGKLTLAHAMHRVAGQAGACAVVHCTQPQWRDVLHQARGRAGTVILRRVDALRRVEQLELADLLDGASTGTPVPWMIAVASSDVAGMAAELLHRLGRVRLHVPPLRERDHDVQVLVSAWCAAASDQRRQVVIRREALEALVARSWPGNVRELHNTLEAAVLRSGSVIGVDALGLPEQAPTTPAAVARQLDTLEREAIVAALARNGHNVSLTARELGISRATLHRRLRTYRLTPGARPE